MSSSLVLKPQGFTKNTPEGVSVCCAAMFLGGYAKKSRMPNVQDCIWTYPRDLIPPQLVNREVPLELWQRAWDLLYQQLDSQFKMEQEMVILEMGCWPFLPCFVPCMFGQSLCNAGVLADMSHQNEMQWLNLVKTVSELFEGHTLAITLEKETQGRYNMKVNVGLQFEIVNKNFQTKNTANFTEEVTTAFLENDNTAKGRDMGIADQLERLNHMYQNRHITEEEYNAAKAKALSTRR